VGTDMFSVR